MESLTNELFEIIVGYLELQDIQRLRLVSRTTAYKANQDTFRSYFRAKQVDITRADLEDFVRFTRDGGLGCLVQHLSLVGIVYNPFFLEDIVKTRRKFEILGCKKAWRACGDEELQQAKDDLDTMRRRQADLDQLRDQDTDRSLLTEALTNIAISGKYGLKSLSLQVAVYREDPRTRLVASEGKAWKWVFQSAAQTFALAMPCLRDSQLSLDSLDVFCKTPTSLCCSLPVDTMKLSDLGNTSFLSTLKSLSISISDPIIHETEYDAQSCGDPAQRTAMPLLEQKLNLRGPSAVITNHENTSSLAQLLSLCPNLEELEISGYSLYRRSNNLSLLQSKMRRRYMHHIAHLNKPLSKLRRLRLGGINVEKEDLLLILRNHATTLAALDLESIQIMGASWALIFSCLKDNMDLVVIQLTDLWDSGPVQFHGLPNQDCTRIHGTYRDGDRNVINVWRPDTKKQISYHYNHGMITSSPEHRSWQQRKRMEFGGS